MVEVVGYSDGIWGVWLGEGLDQDMIYQGAFEDAMNVARECDCQWDGGYWDNEEDGDYGNETHE